MPNRSLQVKADRASRQRMELGRLEGSKACFIGGKPMVPDYDPKMVRRFATVAPETKPSNLRASDSARVAYLKGLIHRGRTPKRLLQRGLLADQGVW